MKRLILILSLLVGFITSDAQIYQQIPGYGFAWNRVRPDSVLHLPSSLDTTLRTNLLTRPQIRQIGDSTWAFSGSRWFNLNRQIDTSGLGSTYLKIADTAAFKNRFVTIYGDSQIIYSKKIFDPSITAAGKIARSMLIKGLLTAAADSDTLIGLEVKPDFNNGIRTGVRNFGIRSLNDNVIGSMRTYASGNTYFGASPQSTADAGYKVDVNGTLRAQGVFYGSQLYTGAHSFRNEMYITATNDGWTKSNAYNQAGAFALGFIGDLRFASTSTIKSVFSFNGSYSNNGTIYGGEMSLMKLWTGDAFGQSTIPVAGQSQYGLNIMPTLNYTASTSNFTGIYYNPTLTSTTGLTHLAMDLVSGDVKIRPLAGAGTRMATVSSTGVLGTTALPYTTSQVDSIAALKPSGSATSGQVTYWNGTNSVTGSSSFTWNNSLLSMGIRNSAAPLAPIHVGNRNVNTSSDAQILISREIDNTIAGNGHGFSDASNFNRSGNAAYNSFDGRIEISGSNNYDHYVAFQHGPVNNSTGTISYVSGLSTILTTNSGIVDQNYGVLALNPAGTGQINKNYGVFIAPMRAGIENYGLYSVIADSTNRWNIYSVGTAPNYFAGYVGIGSVNTVNANLRVNRNISGASSAYSVWQTGVVQSGVTGAAAGFLNQLNTQAASFVLSNYRHYHASQSSIGSGNTLVNQTGFFADETIIGGTNNYGFFGNIPSANRRWNLFMNGTARNLLRGTTYIGDSITYAGSANLSVTGKAYVSDSINAGSIRRIGGTSSEYLMADGSTYSFGGTTNTIPKFTGTSSLGNSSITDNGTAVRVVSNTEIFGQVSLGTTPNTTRSFNVNTAISGSGSSAGGVYQVGVVQSNTSIGYGFFNNAATQATAFNLPEYTHYFARQNVLGAGSSITNQNGFYVSPTLIDATNNYGFRGEIPSGTGRFNLYMNGSGANYLEGYTSIGTLTNDSISKLLVNGIVSADFRSGSNYRLNGAAGAWDRKYAIFGSSGTDRGGFGAFGGTDAITKYYIGQSNTDNVAEFDATTKQTTLFGSVTSSQFRLSALNTAPSSATDTGTLGEIRITSDFIFIATGTNTWKRVAISTW